ncbi:MAG: hypothetical protein IPJ26_05055 [Bacteroidetes bacterium]|nr:hypothetical protein [Bacteroidota bacterium]
MKKKVKVFIFATTMLLTSCGIPKETLQRIQSGKKEMVDLPIDYCNSFPTPTYEQWDKDYNSYNRFLTRDIMRTQVGLTYDNKGVQTWLCTPAVRTHVQLDTATMIDDSKAVIGDWRICCNRKIAYIDSAVYADKKIYRDSELIYNEKDADVFLEISDAKFKMYGTEKGETNYKKAASKNYSIESKRFLMLYGSSKAAASVSFIGIDKEGRLIINTYMVEERKIKGIYITYVAVMTQLIFKRAI